MDKSIVLLFLQMALLLQIFHSSCRHVGLGWMVSIMETVKRVKTETQTARSATIN